MGPGETKRYDCDDCQREFEVTLEPKAKELKDKKGLEAAKVTCCPFCESTNITGEDD